MKVTRRKALTGGAAIAATAATGVFKPAIAQSGPIQIGYLPAFTGPSSSTGIGIGRGTEFAVKEINDAGGIKGRKIELVMRDTQSDPTKAVNAAAELTRRYKVSAIWGPLNSGETAAVVANIARDKVAQLHPCWVDPLVDVAKYPMCFRNAPSNQQIGGAANNYVVKVLGKKKVAVISDATGYGTASIDAYVPMLKNIGAEVVYSGSVDANNPDLKPELLRMQSGGAEAIMPWSVNAGFLARIINTRADLNWDVPIVGQTTLGSGQTKALLAKPENWQKVYPNNFRPVCYDTNDKLTPQTADFLQRLTKANVAYADTLLWWIACGYDGIKLLAEALREGGTAANDVSAYFNSKVKNWKGVYGTISFSPEQHNGFADSDVIMCQANSLKDGAFKLAPGYA
ncbi:MAG: ABC transporter substrate-binding protein [Proteobacteria bacterium]|nr:ABC transporter substrate-binding protein [Pseudomonadota bacterium]